MSTDAFARVVVRSAAIWWVLAGMLLSAVKFTKPVLDESVAARQAEFLAKLQQMTQVLKEDTARMKKYQEVKPEAQEGAESKSSGGFTKPAPKIARRSPPKQKAQSPPIFDERFILGAVLIFATWIGLLLLLFYAPGVVAKPIQWMLPPVLDLQTTSRIILRMIGAYLILLNLGIIACFLVALQFYPHSMMYTVLIPEAAAMGVGVIILALNRPLSRLAIRGLKNDLPG